MTHEERIRYVIEEMREAQQWVMNHLFDEEAVKLATAAIAASDATFELSDCGADRIFNLTANSAAITTADFREKCNEIIFRERNTKERDNGDL